MALIRNTKRREKILDNGFQSNCGSHAKVCTNPSYIEKRAEMRHKSVMLPALQMVHHTYKNGKENSTTCTVRLKWVKDPCWCLHQDLKPPTPVLHVRENPTHSFS